MVRADLVIWALILIFAMMGASRGWVKEVIATFSMLFALFIYSQFGAQIKNLQFGEWVQTKFFIRMLPFLLITFFGYASPVLARGRFDANAKGKIEHGLLSFLIGGFNGYLFWSTILWFAWDSGILTDPALNPPGFPIFVPPPEGWANFFFIKNSAVVIFSGTTLLLVLVAVFLFVIVVLI